VRDEQGRETFHRFWLLHPGAAPAAPRDSYRLPPEPAPRPFPKPAFAGDRLEKKFATPFHDWALGGGGRYLVLLFLEPKNNRLTVFDLGEAREVGHIPLPDDVGARDLLFAAGADKVVVVLPRQAVVQRWHLVTLQREKVAGLPPWANIKAVALGAASHGPVLVAWSEGDEELARAWVAFLDLETLHPTPWRPDLGFFQRDEIKVRAAMNGRAFGLWKTSTRPSGMHTLVLTPDGPVAHHRHEDPAHVVPGPDGHMTFTSLGCFRTDSPPTGTRWQKDFCLPARQGDYYFRVAPVPLNLIPDPGSRLTIYRLGNPNPVLQVPDFDAGLGEIHDQQQLRLNPRHRDYALYDRRLHLFPEARLLVVLPHGNDSIVWRRLKW
jgi:hypothetical protein